MKERRKEGEQGDKTYKISDFRKEKQQDGSWVVYGSDGRAWWHGSTEERANQTIQDYINSGGITKTEKSIPTAPFVTDTNAWTKLGLKVALKEAVAQGAERIAWTTGEQQNERYDLSKQVSSIDYEKKQDGRYFLHFNQGVNSFSETIEETRLADYVGKDVANRIINGEGSLAEISPLIIKDSFTDKYDIVIDNKTIKSNFDTYNDAFNWYKRNPKYENVKRLEGANLKVGGKGMKGFYGEPSEGKEGIVGGVAKSLFKQEPQTIELQNTVTLSGNQNRLS